MSGVRRGGKLSVGIVVYNNRDIIEQTVESVLKQFPADIESRLILLDNCSRDGSRDVVMRLADSDRRISAILNDRNAGFGGGHNRILQEVDGDWHIFCNPDIHVTEGALSALVDALERNPDVALVCPRVHFEDGRLQPLNRRHPTVWDLFLRRFMVWPLCLAFAGRMRRYEMQDIGYDASCEVPFVSGAFMAARVAAMKETGGFDPRYFLYFEDADLSRALQRRGWRTLYCPDALVVHGWRREAHRSLKGMWLFVVSAWKYFGKWGWKLY